MPIAKITGQGLAAIGFMVALLWGCVIGERAMVQQACAERARVMRENRIMQRRDQQVPAYAPVPFRPPAIRVTAG